jgi:uncharacterized Zn-binding protein involved in type VI secretion
MTPLARGCVAAGVIAVVLWALAQAGHTMFLCPAHEAWARVGSGQSTLVLGDGESIARPGDEIMVCATTHRFGPIAWHTDLDCYCAPDAISAAEVGRMLGGVCTLDKADPRPSDAWGACQAGRCSRHLDAAGRLGP